MRCRIVHGNPIGGRGSIENATDGLNPTGNFLERLRVDHKGRNFQLLKLGQQVSPEKGARGQYQVRLQRDDGFDIRLGIPDFRFLLGPQAGNRKTR